MVRNASTHCEDLQPLSWDTLPCNSGEATWSNRENLNHIEEAMCRSKANAQRNNKVNEDVTELKEAREEWLRLPNEKGRSAELPGTPE